MSVVVWVSAGLVAVGALLALLRAQRGPSILDRTIALDVLVSALIAAVCLDAAVERRVDVVPVLVALALVGFVGSVTVARFAAAEPPGAGRVMTREEAAAERAAQLAAEAAEPDGQQAAGPDGPDWRPPGRSDDPDWRPADGSDERSPEASGPTGDGVAGGRRRAGAVDPDDREGGRP